MFAKIKKLKDFTYSTLMAITQNYPVQLNTRLDMENIYFLGLDQGYSTENSKGPVTYNSLFVNIQKLISY